MPPKKSNFRNVLENLDLKKPNETNVLDKLLTIPKKDNKENMPHHTSDTENGIHQADLLYLPEDRNYKYVLVVVDLATRKMDAEPLKNRDAQTVMKALIKIYKRKILKEPVVLQVDDGSEFKGTFKKHFENIFKIHYNEPGRHRSNAVVESVNKILGKIIFRYQQIQELHSGEQNTEWIEFLPKIVESINKHYVHKPVVIDAQKNLPRCSNDSCNVYEVGTKVRRQLDNPIGITGEKLHGKFRATDIRFDPKIQTITQVFISPDSPPLYQLDNNQNVSYTKNQLQKVDKNEKLPEKVGPEKFVIEKLIKRFKKNNKVYFEVKWQNYDKTTEEPRSELIKDVPDLVKEFEKN